MGLTIPDGPEPWATICWASAIMDAERARLNACAMADWRRIPTWRRRWLKVINRFVRPVEWQEGSGWT